MTDIENSAAYTYKQSGIGYNHYGNYNEMSQDDKNSVYNNMGLVPNLGAGASDEATSVTKSAVSPAIVIVNGEQIDLAILNTDTANALNELETIFDKKSIEERQELARLFAQNTYEAIHRLGEAKGWKDGSIEKALLHTATAEITARLAGNAPGSGAIAGAVNELAVNEILTAVGRDNPDASQILSAALGAVVNKAIGKSPDAGAAVAQYGTKWNVYGFAPEQEGAYIESTDGSIWVVDKNGEHLYYGKRPPSGSVIWKQDKRVGYGSYGWDYYINPDGPDFYVDQVVTDYVEGKWMYPTIDNPILRKSVVYGVDSKLNVSLTSVIDMIESMGKENDINIYGPYEAQKRNALDLAFYSGEVGLFRGYSIVISVMAARELSNARMKLKEEFTERKSEEEIRNEVKRVIEEQVFYE